MEKDIRTIWLDMGELLVLVLTFPVSAEHPHYFIKLYTLFWFAKKSWERGGNSETSLGFQSSLRRVALQPYGAGQQGTVWNQ